VIAAVQRAEPSARALVVLHVSHVSPAALSAADRELVDRWRADGILFTSPAGMNDDWYWLHAALASGEGCRVVSNDEMRDHHFNMLHASSFLKWKERHVVHFEIPHAYTHDPLHEAARPLLLPPLPYSHQMQQSGSGVWHLPRAGEAPDRWVCLHPSAHAPDGPMAMARVGADW
jgi:hypothetical protein